MPYDLQQMPVVMLPEGDHVPTIHLLIEAVSVPGILIVGDAGYVLELATDKAMMIIGCAVYQVTYDLLFAPLSGRWLVRKGCLVYG
jgi:hypothetical protein